MPAPHDIDPGAMTDAEFRLKRIQDAAIAFELLLDMAMATERKDDPPCTT